MRVVGGRLRGRALAVPKDNDIRPTSDRVREAVFNILMHGVDGFTLDGAAVLDLFAGTGALALESASRGASVVWMVERDGKAAAVCVANLKIVAKALLKEEVEFDGKVINKSVSSFLASATESEFDLVFIDPPYEITNDEVVADLELLKPLLKDATVVVERSSRGETPAWPSGYTLDDEKSYGDTVVYWLSA